VEGREDRGAGQIRSKLLKPLRFSTLESGWKVAGIRLAIFRALKGPCREIRDFAPLIRN
jgi:hypothetical protein